MISLKENVNKITIIENNEDIINIFKKYLLPQFKFKNKIEIINDDALNYATKKLNYDYVFVDIWHDPSDGIDLYLKFKKLEVKGIKYDYWIEQTMKCYIEE
jgi:spermidine synthase